MRKHIVNPCIRCWIQIYERGAGLFEGGLFPKIYFGGEGLFNGVDLFKPGGLFEALRYFLNEERYKLIFSLDSVLSYTRVQKHKLVALVNIDVLGGGD